MPNFASNANSPAGSIDKQSVEYTDRLLELVQRKLELVESLHQLSVSQRDQSIQVDASVTLGLVVRRDSLVDQLLDVQSQLHVYRDDDPERRQWSSAELRQQCRKLVTKIDAKLQEVLLLDQQTLNSMSQHRDSIAAELRHDVDSNLAQQAYTANQSLQPSVLDIGDL